MSRLKNIYTGKREAIIVDWRFAEKSVFRDQILELLMFDEFMDNLTEEEYILANHYLRLSAEQFNPVHKWNYNKQKKIKNCLKIKYIMYVLE